MVKDRNGDLREVIFRKNVFLNENGSVGGIIGAHFDVTERNRAVRDLKASEERYRTLFESESDAILLVDVETLQLLDCNQAALELYGYERDELLALHALDLSEEPGSTAELIHAIENTARYPQRLHRKKDGTIFPVEITAKIFEWRERRCLLAAIRDITERIQAEEQRQKLESQLIHVQKMESVGRLAGGIAHDFNNMLTPILGYSELLRDDLPTEDPRQASVIQILQAAERSRDLVRQLLAFARRQTLEMKPLDLNRVITGFEKMLRRTLHENINLELHLASGLGLIRADVGQVEQVILNLAVNAQDAMPQGGDIFVETSETVQDDEYAASHDGASAGPHVVLTVSDTGVGMTREVMEKIFEPFFTTKGEGKGVGLGLSTVYGIVRQHGGHVAVYSEPGYGTRFRICFPRIGAAEEHEPVSVEQEQLPTGTETLLLVEDQEQVRTLAESLLLRFGYKVLPAGSIAQARDVLSTYGGEIHLLITDVILPDGNGKELYEQFATLRPNLRVLYMSGYTSDVISHHGVLPEGVQFIQKPFNLKGFAQKVREVLETRL